MPSSPPPQSDPLQPVLADAESELRRRLREACEAEAKGLSTDSTQEIRRLEDALLAAAVAAEQTITVRRHMKRRAPAEREHPIRISKTADRKSNTDPEVESGSGEPGTGARGEESPTRVREFRDDTGSTWRAWPVTPGLSRASASGRGFLGDFQDGWVCFEGLDSTQRRRLPRRLPSWANVTDEELQDLLAQAIDAPGRATKRQKSADPKPVD
jgi:hypothetical protein